MINANKLMETLDYYNDAVTLIASYKKLLDNGTISQTEFRRFMQELLTSAPCVAQRAAYSAS